MVVIFQPANIYLDIFLGIAFYLTFQTPAVVAHLASYTPLGSDRLIKLFAALVKYFLSYGRAITLTFDLRATRLQTTSSGANVLVRDNLLQMTTVIGRLSWLMMKTITNSISEFNVNYIMQNIVTISKNYRRYIQYIRIFTN